MRTDQTERTDLRCKRRRTGCLTSEAAQVDDLDLSGIEFWRPAHDIRSTRAGLERGNSQAKAKADAHHRTTTVQATSSRLSSIIPLVCTYMATTV